MFTVKVNDKEYEVTFDHYVPTPPDREFFDEEKFRAMFGTVCLLGAQSTGSANLNIKDNFNRNIGRKISLNRALQKAFPGETNKEIRKAFWDAYYKARGEKW